MGAQIWMAIGIVGFSLAGVLLIAAVVMFIRFNIPAVLGELSGRTAKKQIDEMRRNNAAAAARVQHQQPVYERHQTDDAEGPTDRLVPYDAGATDVLSDRFEAGATEELVGTDMLEEVLNATTLLSDVDMEAQPFVSVQAADDLVFRIVKNIVVVHTSEVID